MYTSYSKYFKLNGRKINNVDIYFPDLILLKTFFIYIMFYLKTKMPHKTVITIYLRCINILQLYILKRKHISTIWRRALYTNYIVKLYCVDSSN